MLENLPVRSLSLDGITVEGFSRAGVQTYWRLPELKLGFDLGAHPWSFMTTANWFLTHVHIDLMAALPVYVARRRMMKMEPPTIHVPAYALEDLRRILMLFQKLDRCRMACNLVPLEPGQEVQLSREHVVTSHRMEHTVPAMGFIVWDRRMKLKDEFSGLPGNQIRDLKLSGIEITKEVRSPMVAYTGDTSPAGLDSNPDFFEAKILITEMSFFRQAHKRSKVHRFGHMHLDDFIERADRFKNKYVLCGHASTRYTDEEIIRIFQKKMPASLAEKIRLWL